ncbi:unnamed protein product [Dibothriocephalus latus]|uniref:NR LBD domain-containing protein n=1 Tax=Dibothriocephalus latus TaxID=60516 RepID=A0A3P7MHF1_DIBLA|nr:unnamed protein product [Dibothriocephalus latus]
MGGLMGSGSLMSSTPLQPNPTHTQLISQLLRAEPILHNELFRADLHDIKASLIQYITSLEANSAHTELADPKGAAEGTRMEERCTRFLINHVNWARQTPFFASLCIQDQISLLKSAWPEIFLLSLAQVGPLVLLGLPVERPQPPTPVPRQMPIKHPNNSDPNSSTMKQEIGVSHTFSQAGLCPFPGMFAKPTEVQQTSDTQRTERDHHRNSQMRLLCESIGCVANLQLDAVECACLKSLLLFNPGEYVLPRRRQF